MLQRDRSGGAADRGRAEQDRPGRPARAPAPREPLPGRAAGLGAHRRGPRRAAWPSSRARFDDRWERVRLLVPYDERRPAVGALRARHADRGARGHRRRACCVIARLPRRDLPRFAPFLIAESAAGQTRRETRLIELPIQRLRADAVVPTRAYAGDAGLDLAACERVELAPGERALVADRARRRDPRRLRGLRPAALRPRREARHLDRQHARADRLRLPRRAAGRRSSTPTCTRRSSSSRGCGSPSS